MDENEKLDMTVGMMLEILEKCPKDAKLEINEACKVDSVLLTTDLETDETVVRIQTGW